MSNAIDYFSFGSSEYFVPTVIFIVLLCSFARRGFLGIAIVTSVAGFLSSFSPNYISLLILRCLVGTGLGGASVFSSWFLEFVPASNRGKWMVIFSTFWTIGTIVEASLAWVCFMYKH